MDAKVDGGVLEFDLPCTFLEFDFGGNAHEVAHSRAGEKIETLGVESDFISEAIHTLIACMHLCVATDRGASEQLHLKRLVVYAAPHERTGQTVCPGRVALL